MRLLLLVLCSSVVIGCSSDAESSKATDVTSFTSSDGTRIVYEAYGAGPTVVVIHGLTGSKNDFVPLAQKLAGTGLRAIVFDVRGHGASDKPHSPDAYGQQLVTDLRDLLDHLSVDSAHIIGYSMGGDIANKFREAYPDRVRSCVVGGAGLGVSRGWADDPHDFAQIAESLANGHGWVPLLRQSGAIAPGVATEEEIAAVNNLMTDGQDTLAHSALLRGYGAFELDLQKSKDNRVRTLIVVGSKDAEYRSAIELSEALSNSTLQVIDGVNHFEAWTHNEFDDAVATFVTDNENSK